jgi:hypothetical protein
VIIVRIVFYVLVAIGLASIEHYGVFIAAVYLICVANTETCE